MSSTKIILEVPFTTTSALNAGINCLRIAHGLAPDGGKKDELKTHIANLEELRTRGSGICRVMAI